MSDPAIRGRGVAFAYGDRQALAGIDFEVARGSAHGFLGPNGSGKSTLFKILSTLVPPQAGELSVLDIDLAKDPAAVRRKLGVVFQSPAVDRKLTVRENLRYGGRLQGLSGSSLYQRIDELLSHAGLSDRSADRVEELSGGLRRRVEICKALLHRPELLLLDEASTGLDPSARADMWRLIEQQSDLTVLFTTHLMDEAARADRLVLLDAGHVVAEGSPKELMQQVGGQILEIEAADPAAFATGLGAALSVGASVVEGVVRVEGEGVHDLVPRIIERFGDQVQRLSLAHPSLEDVFVHKTGKRFVVAPPEDAGKKKKRRRR
jgi:ABC-2 type transport system ATP-binding protein